MIKLFFGTINTIDYAIGKIATTILAFISGVLSFSILLWWLEDNQPGTVQKVFGTKYIVEEPQKEEPQKCKTTARKTRTATRKKKGGE